MTPPHDPLIADAMRAIEVLEAKSEDAKLDRRESLVALVEDVCRRGGMTHGMAAIEQAVDQVTPRICLPATQRLPARALMQARASDLWRATKGRWRRGIVPIRWRSTQTWTIAKCFGWGVMGAAAVWTPWPLIFRGPFSLAIHHTQIFYSVVVFTLIFSLLVGSNAEKLSPRNNNIIHGWANFSAIFTGWLTAACSFGLMVSTSATDFSGAQNNTAALKHDFSAARALPAAKDANFTQLTKLANDFIEKDPRSTFRKVDIYDPKLEQVAFVVDFNQKECALMTQLDPDFMVTWVNDQELSHPQPGVAPVCENLWHNRVQISNLPHTL